MNKKSDNKFKWSDLLKPEIDEAYYKVKYNEEGMTNMRKIIRETEPDDTNKKPRTLNEDED